MGKITSPSVLAPALACFVGIICSSAIWIAAYYIGVKGNSQVVYVTSPTEAPSAGPQEPCHASCEFNLVESIPWNLTYSQPPSFMSTADAWKRLIANATKQIRIASYYWSLLPEDTEGYADHSAKDGIEVYNALIAAAKRGVSIQITQNAKEDANETAYLQKMGYAQVRSLNFTRFLGSGILHTKAWLVDDEHLYIGSANIDWRSLTQVKELGAAFFNCPCVAKDASKLFEVYWQMGAPNKEIPHEWPTDLSTPFNANNPIAVTLNQHQSAVYMSSAPPELCPTGREGDIDAIIRVIKTARQFIHISVMDYIPATLYAPHNEYWAVIDDALRFAAYNHLHVKLMMSKWKHTRPKLFPFLRSLADINDGLPCISIHDPNTGMRECMANSTGSVEVRIFEVPAFGNQSLIPFARVNHNKYMVTDNTAYIGTSNWSGDYFISTGGLGVVVQGDNSVEKSRIVTDLNERIFMRDWESKYSSSIYDFDLEGNRLHPTSAP